MRFGEKTVLRAIVNFDMPVLRTVIIELFKYRSKKNFWYGGKIAQVGSIGHSKKEACRLELKHWLWSYSYFINY